MSNDTLTTTPTTSTRPRWSTWGGGALFLGGLALLIATILEYFVWQTTTLDTGVFVAFSVLLFANVLLYLIAMFALAFADGGITGRSVVGRLGLVLFAVGWAVQEAVYWTGYHVASLPAALEVLSTIALVITYLGAIAAAVTIALGRVVRGVARWSLLVGLAVGAVCATISRGTTDEVLVTVLLAISCAAQAIVGLTYLRPRLVSATP